MRNMRNMENWVVIAGSRSFEGATAWRFMKMKLDFLLGSIVKDNNCVLISGGARGADSLARHYAEKNSIPLVTLTANWDVHGKVAGLMRNTDMIKIATHAVVFRVGMSSGSSDTVRKSAESGLKTIVYDLSERLTPNRVSTYNMHTTER